MKLDTAAYITTVYPDVIKITHVHPTERPHDDTTTRNALMLQPSTCAYKPDVIPRTAENYAKK